MKVWFGYGSEHSMNLVMIGRFKDVKDAAITAKKIEDLQVLARQEVDSGAMSLGGETRRFSDEARAKLLELKIWDLGPDELEQFAYEVYLEASEAEIRLTTEESGISGFIKVLIGGGGKVEVFSGHDYPPPDSKP
jgi:uncharacterized protein DUF6375